VSECDFAVLVPLNFSPGLLLASGCIIHPNLIAMPLPSLERRNDPFPKQLGICPSRYD